MKWSWPIGSIFGIPVRIHWTFLLLLGWIVVGYASRGDGWEATATGIGFVLSVFGCVILHEAGHALMARRFGVETTDITLLPIGGLARMKRIPREPSQEFWIALAGPAVNVVIAIVLFVILVLMAGVRGIASLPGPSGSFLANLLWVNIILVAFNMLPAFPMDGGRVLRAVLATQMPYAKATRTAATIGQMMAILFGVAALFINPLLLFIALFVYVGAEAEANQAQMHAALAGLTVADAMMTDFVMLNEQDTLDTAADQLLAGSQHDFPVNGAAGCRGVLSRQNLVRGLREEGGGAIVRDWMTKLEARLPEDASLEETIESIRGMQLNAIPVFSNGTVTGLLNLENISELMMIRSARRDEQTPDVPPDVAAESN